MFKDPAFHRNLAYGSSRRMTTPSRRFQRWLARTSDRRLRPCREALGRYPISSVVLALVLGSLVGLFVGVAQV
jgi:hypothetical protein